VAEVMNVNGRIFVHVHGLRELSKALGGAPRQLQRDIAAGMKRAAQPTADRAAQLAGPFSLTGGFASSIKITGGRAGVFLSATDPGAGPIEFAHIGALVQSGPRAGQRVGVPAGGTPARALFPAIEDTIDDLAAALTQQVERTLTVLSMDYRSANG